MAKSPDSTPSPVSSATSVNISAASNRANPFSIDYILSASDEAAAAVAAAAVASSKQHNNSTASQMQQALQLDLINQQRAQLMAAAAAAGSQQTSAARTSETVDQQISNHLQHYLSNQLHMDRRQSAQQQQQLPAQSAAMSQIHKPPNQQPPHPNFLYFMACMLLQQQQQHQNLQREQQARQQACEQQQQHQQQKQHQLISRQPIDLAQSPIDSLAIFARLAGLPTQPQARRTPGNEHNTTSLGKQTSSAHRPLQASNHHSVARHQPYHAPHHHSPSSHLAAGGNSRAAPMNLHQSQAAFATPPLASAIRQPIPHVLATNNDLSHQTELISRSASHLVGHSPWLQKSSQVSQQQQHLLTSLAPTRQTQQQHLSSSSPLSDIRPASSAGNQEQQQQSGCQLERLDNLKPAHSYIGLIGMCILSSPEKRMVLNDIYHFILDNYPYYRNRGSGWRNSVRHNLSLNECFQKAGRAANGKGHYWTIHPANMEDFMLGDFRRRRAQRKVRRWNNMDVPSDESEDESMEDATKPPLPDHFKRSLEMHRRLELSYQKSVEAAAASFGLQAASGVCLARQQPPQPLQDSIGGGQAMATAAAGGVRTVHHHHLGESPSGACSPLMFCKQDNSAL